MTGGFRLACPVCRGPLASTAPDLRHCHRDGLTFPRLASIWRFLPDPWAAYFRRFVREYETVRQAEGRGTSDAAYYRRLPFTRAAEPRGAEWAQRARSFALLLAEVVVPWERDETPLRILDLGAGNGWLAYRLAQRGHLVAAVDLRDGAADGLGAHIHYDTPFLPLQATFQRLPLASGQADLAIFNAAFHYASSYEHVLAEAARVLRPRGLLVIMDSPLYRSGHSGRAMVRAREAGYRRLFGFPSNALPGRSFLTYREVRQLGIVLGRRWRWHWPAPWWHRAAWRVVGVWRHRRETAQFPLLVG